MSLRKTCVELGDRERTCVRYGGALSGNSPHSIEHAISVKHHVISWGFFV
jgi:hypothetical protein